MTLWTNSADDKMMIVFIFFPENRIWHFMQIVSIGDINPFSGKNKKKYFTMLSVKNFTQSATH